MKEMSPQTFTLNFTGDVMPARLIDALLPQHNFSPHDADKIAHFLDHHPSLRNYTHRSPWGSALPLFHASDLNLINLETAVTTVSTPWPDKAFNYRMHPANVAVLTEARIDFLALANNHVLDFGTEGLVETLWTVKRVRPRIAFAGAGETSVEAQRPAVLMLPREGGREMGDEEARARRRSWADREKAAKEEEGGGGGGRRQEEEGEDGETQRRRYEIHVYAASDHPADWAVVPTFHIVDYSHASRARLKRLVTETHGDRQPALKVFSMHWGPNYRWHPDESTIRAMAHFLIDECGVDVIHGHSSHHVQGVEVYRGKLIMYGCGDFVDDYRLNEAYRNDLGAVWRLNVAETGHDGRLQLDKLEIFPTRIEMFQAMLLDQSDKDHEWVRRKITTLSEDMGTNVRKEVGDQGQLIIDLR